MKLLIRWAVAATLVISSMDVALAQDNTAEDTADNSVQRQPESTEVLPQDSEVLPTETEVPREKFEARPEPEVVRSNPVEEFINKDVDWLTLLAGGGIALLLVQFISLLKSRRESHQELQQWFTRWSVEECVEPLLAYLEAINLHFATSRASNMQVDAVPPIPIVAFHRLRVITNSTSIAHIILVLENWSKHKVSTEEYDEVTGLIAKFRSYLLELEGYLLETSINERSDILELRHKKEVINSLDYLNSLKKEMQTIGTKYGRMAPTSKKKEQTPAPNPQQ